MDPELSTAAADQTFAWICKQHQDLIGSVLVFWLNIAFIAVHSGEPCGPWASGFNDHLSNFHQIAKRNQEKS